LEMALRMEPISVYAIVVLLAACAVAPGGRSAGDLYELGDNWVYDIDMSVGTLLLSGTITYQFVGESSKSAGGLSYDTYEIYQYGSLNVSGTLYGSWASGTATISGTASFDQVSLDLVVSDQNLSISVSAPLLTPPLTISLWDHMVSTYSPPGGIGQEPDAAEVGMSWTKNYTIESVERSFDSRFRAITNDSYSYSSTSVYTYMGADPTVVPAGTFECDVVMERDEYGVTTNWMNERVGMVVKSEYHPGSSDSVTQLLVSYSYNPLPSEDWSPTIVLATLGVPMVAVSVTVVIWMARRKQATGKELNVIQAPPSA
jgi:hypothetical protein